ncbi:MAG TPA: DUF4443 domain-containing protein [Nitrososphaeria archaeon]|nr:DUF4443 domain-containing protein [Nitrososphaeria archaeon]
MASVKKALERLTRRQPGPLPSFTRTQFMDLIMVIGRSGTIGRKRLSKLMGLGEGAVRTMLMRLKDDGLIEVVGKEGCKLTQRGKRIYRELERLIKDVGELKLELPWNHPSNYTIIVKNRANLVKRGLEQRDEAIRAGAKAAIILTYKDDKLMMPGVTNLMAEHPRFASSIIEVVKPENGDVIIIVGADDPLSARHGALAAAETLL